MDDWFLSGNHGFRYSLELPTTHLSSWGSILNLKYSRCLLVCVNRYLYVSILIAKNGLVNQVLLWLFSSHFPKSRRSIVAIGHQRLNRTLRHPSTPLMQWFLKLISWPWFWSSPDKRSASQMSTHEFCLKPMFSLGVCYLHIPLFSHLCSLAAGKPGDVSDQSLLLGRFQGLTTGTRVGQLMLKKSCWLVSLLFTSYCWWQHFFWTICRQFEDQGSRSIRLYSPKHYGSWCTNHCIAFRWKQERWQHQIVDGRTVLY